MDAPTPKITFFQFKTRLQNPDYPTSPNVWRVRLALNYKRLPYTTVWVDGPDIAKTCIAEGIPHLDYFADGTKHFTLPALIDATRPELPVKLVDSKKIVDYLEETYPEEDPKRALYPPGTKAFQALAYHFVRESVAVHFRPLVILRMAELQTERTRAGFRLRHGAVVEKAESMTVAERPKAWEKALSALELLHSFMLESGEDPETTYFAGRSITFTDLHIVSNLIFLKLSLSDEEFDKYIRGHSGGRWERLLNAFAEYM